MATRKIKSTSKYINLAKLVGSIIGAVTGVMAGFLGAYTILGMGETNNLYIMIGIIAIKIFGVVLSFGAEFMKIWKIPTLMKEAQRKIDREREEYKTVIHNLERLHQVIVEKLEVFIPSYIKYEGLALVLLVPRSICDIPLTIYFTTIHIGRMIVGELVKVYFIVKERIDLICVVKMNPKAMIKTAIKAAENAIEKTFKEIRMKNVSNKTATNIVKNAGKAAGEAAVKTITTDGTDLYNPYVAVIGNVSESIFLLLNFVFAAWYVYDTVQVVRTLVWGSQEETALQDKVLELKKEANKVVDKIYNYYADQEMPQMEHIEVPFPEHGIPTADSKKDN